MFWMRQDAGRVSLLTSDIECLWGSAKPDSSVPNDNHLKEQQAEQSHIIATGTEENTFNIDIVVLPCGNTVTPGSDYDSSTLPALLLTPGDFQNPAFANGHLKASLSSNLASILAGPVESHHQARKFAERAVKTGFPVWMVWQIHPRFYDYLASGEPFLKAFRTLEGLPLHGSLLCCNSMAQAKAAISYHRHISDLPVGVLLQSRMFRKDQEIDTNEFVSGLDALLELGTSIIGIAPEYVAALRPALNRCLMQPENGTSGEIVLE